jgi:hypothetical protein
MQDRTTERTGESEKRAWMQIVGTMTFAGHRPDCTSNAVRQEHVGSDS